MGITTTGDAKILAQPEPEPVVCEWPECGCRFDLGEDWMACKPTPTQRAALAQPEPAAPRTMIEDFIVGLANEAIKTPDASIAELLGALGYVRAAAPTEVEPDDMEGTAHKELGPPRPLFAHPPQRKPLTKSEIRDVFCNSLDADQHVVFSDLVRAVERAHGIE